MSGTSWSKGDDVLADYDKLSMMTANTPANYIIGIPTPQPRPKVSTDVSTPAAMTTPARQNNTAKAGVGRGAIIEALKTECNTQLRVDLERREQIRQVHPYGHSNYFIEKNFGESSMSAAIPTTPPKLVRDVSSTSSDKTTTCSRPI